MTRPDEIKCRCGHKLGTIRRIQGEVVWQTKCKNCKRVVEVALTPRTCTITVVHDPPPAVARPVHLQ